MFHTIGMMLIRENLYGRFCNENAKVMIETSEVPVNNVGVKDKTLLADGTAHIDYGGHNLKSPKHVKDGIGKKWETLIKTGEAHINHGVN